MDRFFFRSREQKDRRQTCEQMDFAVTGLGQSVGTTFVATALAFYFRDMGKKVSYTECLTPADCRTLYYDAVAMDKRFAHRNFYDIYQMIAHNQPVRQKGNLEEGICWILPTPQNCQEQLTLTDPQKARLIGASKEEIRILDFAADGEWDSFLLDTDMLIVVVDPLPSKLIRNKERFRKLKKMELSGQRVIWIVNKANGGIHRKQVRAYLKSDRIFWLDAFDTAQIYLNEYTCKFHWHNVEIERKMMDIFTKVSQF